MGDTPTRWRERTNDAFRAPTEAGETINSRTVVLATGPYQQPAVPPIARQLSAGVLQLSPETYTSPAQIPAGSALVVGDGATGRHIARELTATHHVLLSTGKPRRVSPEHILGKSLFWWMDKLGLVRESRTRAIGK